MPGGTRAADVRRALRAHADPVRARHALRYFKTAPGEYGHGDVFIGVTVPAQRAVARQFRSLPLTEVEALLTSPTHEERLTALLILVDQFRKTGAGAIYRLFMRRLRWVNNWDLVDTAAPAIVGGWLLDKPRDVLDRLARSQNVWRRRVAMLATLRFIVAGEHRDAIRIATLLVHDEHDLIQKAVGWMLREVGQRASLPALRQFLGRHAATMPRTMLRYAIERLPPAERQRWMHL